MQLCAKVFLIVFVIKNIRSEIKFCDNKNAECKPNDFIFSNYETTDLSSMVQHVIKYFHDLNQKCDNKINTIADDIDDIKKSLQSERKPHFIHSNSLNTLTDVAENETDTDAPPNLYESLWVIIQRRQDGSVNFYRSWDHYKHGFGNTFREFFIGLDKIYYLTNSARYELLIKLEDWKGIIKYALYDDFLVGNESEKYQLKKLGNYSGNAGDYMRNHEGMFFSTKDRDNDASDDIHCANHYQGSWWYNNCLTSNLNGPFRSRYVVSNVGITWGKPDEMQVHIVQMMIRLKR